VKNRLRQIDRSIESSVEEKSIVRDVIDRDRATTNAIEGNAIDRSNLDIFGTIWNNDDMSLFLDIFRYFLDILNILDIF
jgi:hypothetical protein